MEMENTCSSETKSLVDGSASESAEPSTIEVSVEKQKLCIWQKIAGLAAEPLGWVGMLCRELSPSFVLGVALVYGVSKGFGDAVFHVASDYYWKDARKMQPAAVQVFLGLYYIPWILKPVWGILTDAVPVRGYRRRPYFIIAGIVGVTSTVVVLSATGLPVVLALLCLVGMMASVAIGLVTIDACIARNSIEKPSLAPDMQSLSMFTSSVGALAGFCASGVFVHKLGPQGALGLMAMPALLLVLVGFVIYEQKTSQLPEKQKIWAKVSAAVKGTGKTIAYPAVWKPTLYMYLSLALSINTHEGQFYWYTDQTVGPAFSQEFIGIIYAIGAVASMVGVLIYHKILKNFSFRSLLFYAQLLYAVSGFLDLIFVLRWNRKLGIPDYFFVILEESCSHIITRIRWMPMNVLSTKLCPPGIEGTFFALLTCIDSLGFLSSKMGGGVALRAFRVTRTDFRNLWLVVLMRNLLRLSALCLIFLVPRADQTDVLLPPDILESSGSSQDEEESLELAKFSERG
ncbi:probable folate-biopterin transporter 6 [Ananas comosus]|uniref:Probable folate-biopterin transporter 6 n=1 Tax=Ananas comosus TaxID=4615 RepID=A0A6P5GWD9_ANACO|nr:probable folate-biopterin transporter 6 [Ananas comosus]